MTREQIEALRRWTHDVARHEVNPTAATICAREAAFEALLAAFAPAPVHQERYATPGTMEQRYTALFALLMSKRITPSTVSGLTEHIMKLWPELKAIMEPPADDRPSPEELDAWGDQVRTQGLANGSLDTCKICSRIFLVAAGHDCLGDVIRREPCA